VCSGCGLVHWMHADWRWHPDICISSIHSCASGRQGPGADFISSSPVSCFLLLLSACTLLMPAASVASTAGGAGASAGGGSGWWRTTSLQGRLGGRWC
jgi:hypothetical protein